MGKKPGVKKIKEALTILNAVGVPVKKMTERRKKRVAMALLAVANMRPGTGWEKVSIWDGDSTWSLTTREMIEFWNAHYGEKLSSGSYDDVRRKDLKILVLACIVMPSAGAPNASTNNPTRRYAVRKEAGEVLRKFGTVMWSQAVQEFRKNAGTLAQKIERPREMQKIPVQLPQGQKLSLSPGAHNELQKAIIEEFLPRFAPDSKVLYIGDTQKKSLIVNETKLEELGFPYGEHDMLPDIVAYYEEKQWLLLIEAVHSANPISQLRHIELEKLTSKCKVPRIYVSVFKDRSGFREWVPTISWETEVWLCESPDHLIHFNGAKFLGPYTPTSD